MLRVWYRRVEGKDVWRILLTNVHTGEETRFDNLQAVMDFLQRCVAEAEEGRKHV